MNNEQLDTQIYCGADSVLDALFLSDDLKLSERSFNYLMQIKAFISERVDSKSKCIRSASTNIQYKLNRLDSAYEIFDELPSDSDSRDSMYSIISDLENDLEESHPGVKYRRRTIRQR